MLSTNEKIKITQKAIALIQQRSKISSTLDTIKWTRSVMDLLKLRADSSKNDGDYQYLIDVAESRLNDMRNAGIGSRIIEIIKENNASIFGYIKPAITSYSHLHRLKI